MSISYSLCARVTTASDRTPKPYSFRTAIENSRQSRSTCKTLTSSRALRALGKCCNKVNTACPTSTVGPFPAERPKEGELSRFKPGVQHPRARLQRGSLGANFTGPCPAFSTSYTLAGADEQASGPRRSASSRCTGDAFINHSVQGRSISQAHAACCETHAQEQSNAGNGQALQQEACNRTRLSISKAFCQ